MQLKKWFAAALVAVLLDVVTPILLVTTSATAATVTALTLGVTVNNAALAAVGGAAVLLGAAGLIKASGRGKRSVPAPAGADDGFSVNAIEILFASAASLDRDTNCGLRLICELAATPEDQLADDEALIMSLFEPTTRLTHDQINSPVTPFQLAAFLGHQSASAQACATTYQKCQYNSNQIIDILRQNGSKA